jgi:hypothetical protein
MRCSSAIRHSSSIDNRNPAGAASMTRDPEFNTSLLSGRALSGRPVGSNSQA